jgi:hypothetical protein
MFWDNHIGGSYYPAGSAMTLAAGACRGPVPCWRGHGHGHGNPRGDGFGHLCGQRRPPRLGTLRLQGRRGAEGSAAGPCARHSPRQAGKHAADQGRPARGAGWPRQVFPPARPAPRAPPRRPARRACTRGGFAGSPVQIRGILSAIASSVLLGIRMRINQP